MNDPAGGFDWNDRRSFLGMGLGIEAVALLIGLGLGWLVGIDPWSHCRWTIEAAGWGLLATGPLLLIFGLAYTVAWPPFRRIRELLIRLLGQPLAACRWYELLLLAAMAGLCEEVLFRGVIQPWISAADAAAPTSTRFLVALVASNLVFALLHSVTPTYAAVAGLIGCYLGLVGLVDILPATGPAAGQGNLAVPVIAHGVYDFIGFLVIAAEGRKSAETGTGIVELD
ncbi:MAG: CPBP family intramembrane metalloprotease [Planctomycetaceae bacterium]|nr:CPBP family intramembrane metalloprotease [Planctomycetaceae bacterium]